MKVLREDPYLPIYAYEKGLNPEKLMVLRAFREKDIWDVNKLIELAQGKRESVKTDKDWHILSELIVFYIQRWPQEWMEFRNTMPEIKETRRNGGYSQSKEIKYLLAIPFRLERLIKAIFPNNRFDKKFAYEFIRRFKVFQVGGR